MDCFFKYIALERKRLEKWIVDLHKTRVNQSRNPDPKFHAVL